MISSFLLTLSAAAFGIAYGSHRNYQQSATPGGLVRPEQSLLLRNIMLVAATVLGCVGAALKVGGF